MNLLLLTLLVSSLIISIIDGFVQKETQVLLACLSKTKSPHRKETKGIQISKENGSRKKNVRNRNN